MAAVRCRCASALVMLVLALAAPGDVLAARELVDAPVVWYEDDRRSIPMPAVRDPSLHKDMFESSLYDPLQNTLYFPRLVRNVGVLFGGDHVPMAANVNALGEVPNSTWFTNRIGLFAMNPVRAAAGSGTGRGPDVGAPWTVVQAKSEGVTPGFTVKDGNGAMFLIKFDPPGYPGMTTSAGVIVGRIMHAAGYNVPDDAVVHFRREELILDEGVMIDLPDGSRRAMTEADLDTLLAKVWRRDDGRFRAIASRFLDGRPAGPFNFKGRRQDDPNDTVHHENRRELRGLRTFSAWLASFDTKQGNTLDMFVTDNDRSFLRHYLIDFASTLGAGAYGPVARFNHEYTLSLAGVARRHVTLGLTEDAWRRIRPPEGLEEEVAYFSAEFFDPRAYRPLQPNPAFSNRTDRDGYWAAKIISAFTDEHLEAIVAQGQYRNPRAAAYVCEVLCARRDIIARVYFDRVPPLDFFTYEGSELIFHDLGAERGIYPGTTAIYRTRWALCDAAGRRGAWSPWQERLKSRASLAGVEPAEARSFVAVECQVDRGQGWSRAVTAYVAMGSGSVIAVER